MANEFQFTLNGIMPLLMHADAIDAADTLVAWRKDPANKNISTPGVLHNGFGEDSFDFSGADYSIFDPSGYRPFNSEELVKLIHSNSKVRNIDTGVTENICSLAIDANSVVACTSSFKYYTPEQLLNSFIFLATWNPCGVDLNASDSADLA